ncbi:MAG TPA: V4R domain-containing protein [Chitinispirillaceae bacterium]|nr:V4R domain-containing protein [Chitinispirillaceae bacterium]
MSAEVINPVRKTLGDTVPLSLFRALRMGAYEGMKEVTGRGASAIITRGGLLVGRNLGIQILKNNMSVQDYLAGVVATCKELSIGYVSVIDGDLKSFVVVKVEECVTCSNVPDIGETICHFEGGVISGIFEMFTKKMVRSTEIECCAKGNSACVFDVRLGQSPVGC